ncbi:hypothetical protein NM688_g5949 [Phlebia brevispora]|uniref:Uncharacterized protein n=1 Tax=Phlebia brevispora TaxID=194682 RepID=A0ACC1SMM4_9APHY|nr:hypothetical protein NM688_g5949 [Phlebia brevispora]
MFGEDAQQVCYAARAVVIRATVVVFGFFIIFINIIWPSPSPSDPSLSLLDNLRPWTVALYFTLDILAHLTLCLFHEAEFSSVSGVGSTINLALSPMNSDRQTLLLLCGFASSLMLNCTNIGMILWFILSKRTFVANGVDSLRIIPPRFGRIILIVLESYTPVVVSSIVAIISLSLRTSLWTNIAFDIASPSLGIAFSFMIAAAGSKASVGGLIPVNSSSSRSTSVQPTADIEFASVVGGVVLPQAPHVGDIVPAPVTGGIEPVPFDCTGGRSYDAVVGVALQGHISRGAEVNLQLPDMLRRAGTTISRSDSDTSSKCGSIIVM